MKKNPTPKAKIRCRELRGLMLEKSVEDINYGRRLLEGFPSYENWPLKRKSKVVCGDDKELK